MNGEFGSDYEIDEAAAMMFEESEGQTTGVKRNKNIEQKKTAILEPRPQEKLFNKLVEEIRELRSALHEEANTREKALLKAKMDVLIRRILKKTSGRYGKRSQAIIDEAKKRALEITSPDTEKSFDAGLKSSESGRIIAAAESALNRKPSGRNKYINNVSEKIAKDLKEKAEEVRIRIEAAMNKLRGEE